MQTRWRFFFGQLGVSVCTTGNTASMGIGLCLALLRSRWTGLVGFHQDNGGHMQDSSLLLTGFVLSVSCNTCACSGLRSKSVLPPTSTAGKVFSPWKICHLLQIEAVLFCCSPARPLCNHGDRAVIVQLHPSETFNPLLGYSVCHYDSDLLKVIQQPLQHLFTCSQLLHLLSLLKQLDFQCKLASLAKYRKAHSSDTSLTFMNILSGEITHPSSCWVLSSGENSL